MDYGLNPIFSIEHQDRRQKYRALQVLPSQNLSGEWMCSVASYFERDVWIQKMQIIVPEKSFQIHFHELKMFGKLEVLIIICKVAMISPEPYLRVMWV